MENVITYSKVIHVLKVAIWKKQYIFSDFAWKFLFICGTDIYCYADTFEEFDEKMKAQNNINIRILPQIVYYPPSRSKEIWFDKDIVCKKNDLQIEDEATAVCIGPLKGGLIGPETYEISPWEITYIDRDIVKKSFYTFYLHKRREIARDLFKMIWHHLITTSNIGFKIA